MCVGVWTVNEKKRIKINAHFLILSVRMGKVLFLCASVKKTLLMIFLTQKVCLICKR